MVVVSPLQEVTAKDNWNKAVGVIFFWKNLRRFRGTIL